MDYERFQNASVSAVPKSGIRKFFDIVQTMPQAISLGVGEPDFITPYHIRNAAIDSLLDGETQYTSNWGKLSLRNEIAYYLKHRYGLTYDPHTEILATVGASEGIDLAHARRADAGRRGGRAGTELCQLLSGRDLRGRHSRADQDGRGQQLHAHARNAAGGPDQKDQGHHHAVSQQPDRRDHQPGKPAKLRDVIVENDLIGYQRRDLFRTDL